jgi:hypothetical protein
LLPQIAQVIEEGTLSDSGPGHAHIVRADLVSCGHEVDKLGHEPYKGIADQVFSHHALAFFGIPTF